MSEALFVTDVSPRDGLQNQAADLSTTDKLRLIELLIAAGVRSIEFTSFVSPRAVPMLADAPELARALGGRRDVRLSALVPNLKGLERAREVGVSEVAIVLAVTETMNLRNINMDLQTAAEVSEQVLTQAKAAGLRTRGYLAVAFDCPFEGKTSLTQLIALARRLQRAGADEIVIADTIGSASPREVRERLYALSTELPIETLSCHFHDTRGLALANVWSAIEVGVRRFDGSVGGLGGCPFAPGAAGNLATEDLVQLAHGVGFSTSIDPLGLLEAIDFAQSVVKRQLGRGAIAWLERQRSKGIANVANCS